MNNHPPHPPRPWLSACLGCVLGAVLAILIWAPSAWLASWVDQLSEHQILLLRPSGTLWSGQAQLSLSAGSGSKGALSLPSPITWRVSSRWDAPIEVRLNALCCFATPLVLSLHWQHSTWALQLGEPQITLPTPWLQGLGAPWNTLALRGMLHIQGHNVSLEWDKTGFKLLGSLEFNLDQLSSRLSTLEPLGSYQLQILGGESTQIVLKTRPNSHLLLSGQGRLEQGVIHFDGLASTALGDEMALSNLLNVLGQRQGQEARLHLN